MVYSRSANAGLFSWVNLRVVLPKRELRVYYVGLAATTHVELCVAEMTSSEEQVYVQIFIGTGPE